MRKGTRQRIGLSGGTELSFITAGEASSPALLLLHGFPNSAQMYREVMPELSEAAYVIAPDLPGFGESDVLPAVSFPAFGQAITELLDRLAIGPRYIYLHDWGAPVGFHIAIEAPERVLGLIIQNANAHRTGLGPQWAATMAYGSFFEGRERVFADEAASGVPAEIFTGEKIGAADGGGQREGRLLWRRLPSPCAQEQRIYSDLQRFTAIYSDLQRTTGNSRNAGTRCQQNQRVGIRRDPLERAGTGNWQANSLE
jgi:pimeloyl-ACP methyl ester carboxylesterase